MINTKSIKKVVHPESFEKERGKRTQKKRENKSFTESINQIVIKSLKSQ